MVKLSREHQPPAPADNDARRAVHERDLSDSTPLCVRECLFRDSLRAAQFSGGMWRQACGVGPAHDVGIEHGEHSSDIAAADGHEKRLDHMPLAREILVRQGGGTADAVPCTAGEFFPRSDTLTPAEVHVTFLTAIRLYQ